MKTMVALMHIKSDWATAVLRSVLSRPRLSQEASSRRTSSGWRIDFGDGDMLWSGEYSAAAWAALCLAKLGDLQSLPAIQTLADASEGKDRELLDKALQFLQGQSSKTPPDEK